MFVRCCLCSKLLVWENRAVISFNYIEGNLSEYVVCLDCYQEALENMETSIRAKNKKEEKLWQR